MTDTPEPTSTPEQNPVPQPGEAADTNATDATVNVPTWRPDTPLAPTSDYHTPAPPIPPQPTGPPPQPSYPQGYPQQPPPGYPQPPVGGYPTAGYPAQPPGYGQPPQSYGATAPWQPGAQATGQTTGPTSIQVPRVGRGRRPLIIGGIVVAVLAAFLITAFLAPGFLRSKQLDINAVQDGVKQVLTDSTNGYGATNVKDVRCNNGANPTIKQGASFDCEVSINGAKHQVKVTFGDNSGTYWVGGPS